jgi:hypothetical protein
LDRSGPSEMSRLRIIDLASESRFENWAEKPLVDTEAKDGVDADHWERRASYCASQCVQSSWGSIGLRHTGDSVVDCSLCEAGSHENLLGGIDAARARWTLALRALRDFPTLRERAKNLEGKPMAVHLVELRAKNWPGPGLMTAFRGVLMGMALWLASIGFGAVHAAAWHDYFPSRAERIMWRMSSLYIMGSGLLWLLINFLGQVWPSFDRYWDSIVAGNAHRATYIFLAVVCTICGVAYCLARLFLVAESIISLRKLPTTTYRTPDWTPLIPHI